MSVELMNDYLASCGSIDAEGQQYLDVVPSVLGLRHFKKGPPQLPVQITQEPCWGGGPTQTEHKGCP